MGTDSRRLHAAPARTVMAVLLALAAFLAIPISTASAGLYHPGPPACSFGPDGTSATNFPEARRLAFQQATDRLYLSEPPEAVYGFDASNVCPAAYPLLPGFGPLLTPERVANNSVDGIAVDNTSLPSKGNLYIAGGQGNALLGYDSTADVLSGFPKLAEPEQSWNDVAVDPGGNVWAIGGKRGLIEFSANGAELDSTIDVSGLLSPQPSLAFDAEGNLYLGGSGVWKFDAPSYDDPVQLSPLFGIVTVDRSTGDLYIATERQIYRYDSSGALLERFPEPSLTGFRIFRSIAIDEASKTVYAYEGRSDAERVFAFQASALPDLTLTPPSAYGETTVTLGGAVHPDGLALDGCKFEYVTEAAYEATGFSDLSSGGEHECEPAFGTIPTSGTTSVSADLTGLAPGVPYRYRLAASNANGTNTIKGAPGAFTLAKPAVETVGSPIRTATTARLDSRLDPHGLPTTYSFEYLTEAQFQADGESFGAGTETTPAHLAGAGDLTRLVSQSLANLTPATTYRYRALADNGAFGGPAHGEPRTLTTRSSQEEHLTHGAYPGPPGSDRAWEQVNLPDTSGNPVGEAAGISDDGEAALYRVSGGTSVSEAGTFYDYLFAHRPPAAHPSEGWRTESVWPSREAATYSAWRPPQAGGDLATIVALNLDLTTSRAAGLWRIPTGGGSPRQLYALKPGVYGELYLASDDGSRALLALQGENFDPAHPSPGGAVQLYDVSSGLPRLASLLPGEAVPSCGVALGSTDSPFAIAIPSAALSTHWVSADGSRLFFASAGESCGGSSHFYMRDFAANGGEGETYPVDQLETSPGVFEALSGPDCPGAMLRSNAQAAYFWTQSRLVPEDTAIAGACADQPRSESTPGGDVYRYDLQSHALSCLTCGVAPGGGAANVLDQDREGGSIALAADGSRLYFTTVSHLLPGAPEAGNKAIYRVDAATGSLAYVGPLEAGDRIGENPQGAYGSPGSAISANGRFLEFRSAAPALDALTGSDNANTLQLYLYDDVQRSLNCVSCPSDGRAPRAAAKGISRTVQAGPNMTPLAANGDFAFATPTPLTPADQNTAPKGRDPEEGGDVYEWRDGRALLVSDGLTSWPPGNGPAVQAIAGPQGQEGRDLFFTEAAQLTPDAPDGYARLYDARIGGGIDFSAVSKPCPLEVCQGAPVGAPEESAPGSVFFSGPGNLTPPSPVGAVPATPKARALTRAQLLARALRACKTKPKRKRAACVVRARKRYGLQQAEKAVANKRRTPR